MSLLFSVCAAAVVVVLSGADSPGGANAATQEEEEVVTLQEPIPPLTWFKYYFAYADPLDMLMMLVGTAGAIVTVRRKHRAPSSLGRRCEGVEV